MSDNPADSLRRELEAATWRSLVESSESGKLPTTAALAVFSLDVRPLISAALKAARAEGTEETVEILLPLVTYLCDNHADRYGGNHCIDAALDLLRESDSRLKAARADERERLKAALRQIHWVTVYASGKFEGLPCCGCCAWLDGVRRPWPCGTLQAVGFTDDDIPAELRGGV